jgi:hypothetical protein
VGGAFGWGQGRGQDALPDLPAIDRRAAGPGTVGEAGQAKLLEAGPPQPDRRDRDAELVGDRDVGDPLGRPQDDLQFTARGFERMRALDHLQGWLTDLMTA